MLNTGKLEGRTLFITGGSRGIGKAIALKAAKDGANIVIAAKTTEPHPKLPGTIYTAARESGQVGVALLLQVDHRLMDSNKFESNDIISLYKKNDSVRRWYVSLVEEAGGKCLPCVVDVRNESQIIDAVKKAVDVFGGIDIVINNASAISLTGTLDTDMKRYDLMHNINTRGTFLVSKICLPYLKKSKQAHILNISPPLNMNPNWFKDHVAYTMAKYGMSMCILGMAEEFKKDNISVNALWPRTVIHTAAVEMLSGINEAKSYSRKPDIMADAAYSIVTKPFDHYNGQFLIDDEVLQQEGIIDFDQYLSDPANGNLMMDFFLGEYPHDGFNQGKEVAKRKSQQNEKK